MLLRNNGENMAKTTVERQKVYRKNRAFARENGNGERRINAWVSTSAYLALERLAQFYGVTKRGMLEKLIEAEDKNITSSLDPNATEWEEYLSVTQ